jgi:pimeloyl-ACP methyl ester carboxylesterase
MAANVGPDRIDVAYERFGDPAAPPVLLIMGGGAQMITWPEAFCAALVEHGLQPIRFDNRDTGRSTHFADGPAPDIRAAIGGDLSSASYTLSDMAADTVGLLDALGFESAHLVGASLGGMVAQTVAIEHPARVRTLTSMMSTTGDPAVGQADFAALAGLGAPPWDDRQAYVQWQLNALRAIGSPNYPLDEAAAAERSGRAWDRDHDPLGMLRQSVAVLKSGDRTEALRRLRVPALVLHGADDRMCDLSGGRATAAAIPGAELVVYDGMGHGFPPPLLADFADRIAGLVRDASERLKLSRPGVAGYWRGPGRPEA